MRTREDDAPQWWGSVRPEVVLWDLDGCLLDSSPGIFAGIDHTLAQFGAVATDAQKHAFIGPPLMENFTQLLDQARASDAVDIYRSFYAEHGQFACTPYAGVIEVLRSVSEAGIAQAVATAKTESFARAMCERAGFTRYFASGAKSVYGASEDLSTTSKVDIVARALLACGAGRQTRAVMVGDRRYDIEAANFHGLASAGAMWGFGSAEELRAAEATLLAPEPSALHAWLLPALR